MGFHEYQCRSLLPRSPQSWKRHSTWQKRRARKIAYRIVGNTLAIFTCAGLMYMAAVHTNFLRISYLNFGIREATQTPTPPSLTRSDLQKVVFNASHEFKVPAQLIWAVITVESNFDPYAVSPVGAKGLMQLMPGTIKDMEVMNPYNPVDNVRGGTRYLRYLLDQFKGNRERALAAYNAGLQKVRRHRGIPPYSETRKYVKKVMSEYRETLAQGYGNDITL